MWLFDIMKLVFDWHNQKYAAVALNHTSLDDQLHKELEVLSRRQNQVFFFNI